MRSQSRRRTDSFKQYREAAHRVLQKASGNIATTASAEAAIIYKPDIRLGSRTILPMHPPPSRFPQAFPARFTCASAAPRRRIQTGQTCARDRPRSAACCAPR
eukprot:3095221-Pleurochrysis_carterae.AAC.1